MACFCAKTMTLPAVSGSMSIMAVPPQLSQLANLLGLQASASARADVKMGETLPNTTYSAWMKATVAPAKLPAIMVSGGGPMLRLAIKLAVAGQSFPLTDPKALMAALQQAAASIAAQILPAPPMQAMSTPAFGQLALAAKMTLALRAKGICPMVLSGADMQFAAQGNLGASRASYGSCVSFAAKITAPTAKIAITPAQLDLAMNLAALAPLATAHQGLGLPPASDPKFAQMLMSQLAALAKVPAVPLPLDKIFALAEKLNDLANIQEAFGEDAMTPAGTARINAMLAFMARLNLPLPLPQMQLQEQLDLLPPLEDVKLGAQTAQASGASLSAAMSVAPPPIPIEPLLDALAALAETLKKLTGTTPFGPCDACAFPATSFAA